MNHFAVACAELVLALVGGPSLAQEGFLDLSYPGKDSYNRWTSFRGADNRPSSVAHCVLVVRSLSFTARTSA